MGTKSNSTLIAVGEGDELLATLFEVQATSQVLRWLQLFDRCYSNDACSKI